MVISFCKIEGGYEPITYEKFRSFSDIYDYYIYVCVVRTKEKMVEFSLSQWETLLELSRPQTISKLKRVIEKGIICKREGKYTDEEVAGRKQKKQEKNIYYLPQVKEKVEQKENVANKPATSSDNNVQVVQENNNISADNEQEETREHNWYVKGSQLTPHDFYIYITTNDEKLKKQAEARINAIFKNEKGKYVVESLMKEAQEKIKVEKRKAEQEMLKQMTNAVRLKDGTIVAVDENIDTIDVNDVDCIFYSYYGQHLEGYIEVKGFQTGKLINGKFVYDDHPDMIQRGWELYKQHVKTGEMLTSDKMRSIKDTVVNEFFPDLKDETETKIIWKKKKDETDISKFVKEEKKKKREIIDIAAIVVEDWELDEKKREEEQKNNKTVNRDYYNSLMKWRKSEKCIMMTMI